MSDTRRKDAGPSVPTQQTPNSASENYLHTLLEIGRALSSSLELDQVLHLAIEQVVAFVRAERGFILLVEEGTNRVRGKAAHNIDPVGLERVLTGRDPNNRPEVSRTIVEQALREKTPVVSLNAMEDPRFAAHTSVRLSQVRSVVCVPLIVQGRTIGIVYLDNRVASGVFDDHRVEMVSAFANQAAVAIENARLYENLRRSMQEQLALQDQLHAKETERLALEEANRLKSDYIGFVSHELRNPLTTIRGFVQTMGDHPDLDDETREEFYATIEAEADRMLALINDLLDSARLEARRPLSLAARPVDLRGLILRIARTLRFNKSWTPRHTLSVEIAPDLPAIEADEDKLHQVLANLVSNAVKYSPKGGQITLAAKPTDAGVSVSVSDQGLGMNEEQQSRLFGRFERVERSEIEQIAGTGLGLYLTRHLVELHGGRIFCDSAPAHGSTFTVWLPLNPAP